MTTERRQHLREIMALAWQKVRWERVTMRRVYSMADGLRHAWAWFKGAAQREAAEKAAKADWDAAGGLAGVTHLRNVVRSPIRRSLTGQRYAGSRDYSAAYTTSRLGV